MTAIAARPEAPPRRWREDGTASPLPTWASFAVAALPLIVAAIAIVVRRPVIDWSGDRALTELGVREAVHGHQLLGVGGRFGWRHPGPLWLQLLVPGYELTGHAPWSLAVGAIALHIAMIGIAIAAVARGAGRRGAVVLAAAVALYLRATGMRYWTNLWAGYAITWPLLALLAVAALGSSRRRDVWALPGAVLLGTLLVQTDVSTAVVVLVVVAGAAGLRAARSLRARPGRRTAGAAVSTGPAPAPAGRGAVAVAAALVLLVVAAWAAPLVQQATHHPGNITLLVRFARAGAGGHPLRLALASVGAAMSVLPAGARWVLRPGVEQHLGAGPLWGVAVTVAGMAGCAAVAVVAWRRGRTFAGDLALLTALGIVAGVVSISRIDGPVYFYLLTWVTILPVSGVTAAVLALWPATRDRDWATPAVFAVAATVAVGVALLHGGQQDWDRQASGDVAAQTSLATRALGPSARGLVLVHVVTSDTWPDGAGVALQLQRGGAQIEVDRGWVFLFGDAFAPRRTPPSAELWFARPHEAPDLRGIPRIVELGRVHGVDVYARRN
ncbi:MAG TPA: hypothetical protein VMU14_19925 [Acidimicrobiales bacterium]|nr:hypothetical protein [Acidimicrobiales bacterium]